MNNSQSNSNRTSDTKKTQNKVQLILPYSEKQGIKLIAKIKKYIRKTLPENIETIVTIRATNCLQSSCQDYHQLNLVFANALMKHIQKTILEKLIAESREE